MNLSQEMKIRPIQHFRPDIIIEATSVCDRACPGCYAPNLVSAGEADEIFRKFPERYLDHIALIKIFHQFEPIPVIAIRGGEPSLHPRIDLILKIARFNGIEVYFETHGRWALEERSELLNALRENLITVKISYDRMHGLSREALKLITKRLDKNLVDWKIAVTSADVSELADIQQECSWIDPDKFLFQKKASTVSELFVPPLGVITVQGELKNGLTHSFGVGELAQ